MGKRVPMDLYFYEKRHAELLAFYRSLDRALSRGVIVGMLEQSRRRGGVSLDVLAGTVKGDKGRPFVIRLWVDRDKFPDLIKAWDAQPRNARSAFFVARVLDTLRQMKSGALLSYSAIQPGLAAHESHLPPDAYVENITIEAPAAPEDQEENESAPLDAAVVDGLTETAAALDGLLGSLDIFASES